MRKGETFLAEYRRYFRFDLKLPKLCSFHRKKDNSHVNQWALEECTIKAPD